MKKLILAAVAAALLLSAFALAGCSKKVPAGAIAAVGDGVVTQKQFDEIWSEAQAQYKSQDITLPEEGSLQYNQIKASIVSYLVQNEVIAQVAARDSVKVPMGGKDVPVPMDVKVSDKELQERLDQIKTQVGGQKKFDKLLEQQGYTLDALKTQLVASMLQSQVQQKIVSSIKIDDAEIKKYYEEHKDQFQQPATIDARHVLVKTKALANVVRSALLQDSSDANWKKVAKKFSTDTGTKSNGGELGTFPKGRMVKPFEKVAFSLDLNQISEPVKTTYGWHVIEVTKKTAPSEQTLEEAKAMIEQTLVATKQQQVWQDFIERALKDADVAYAPGFDPETLTASPSPAAGEPTPGSQSASPSPSPSE